ncbi:MAG: hypothetical protein JNJ77_11245 [Planctomycetia bacterium]|nr:hypothetical protein [Planctomycetia bacterium]
MIQRFNLFWILLVVLAGCMPNPPRSTVPVTGPAPTFRKPTAPLSKPKEVLERAITARGGEALLKKLLQVTYKGKGKSTPSNVVSSFDFITISALPHSIRDESTYEDGTKFVQVLGKEKGWVSISGKVKEMDPAAVRAVREQLYFNNLMTLVPLRDVAYTLEPLQEERKEGVMTQGFTVKCKDQQDLTLYFDKDTGLPMIAKTRVFDPNLLIDRDQETIFTRYAVMQGIQFPQRWVIYTDGNKAMELTFEELTLHNKVDDIIFTRPQ